MKTKSCGKMLGNGLMNDAWFGQTGDPAKTGQTSRDISDGWRRRHLSCLALSPSAFRRLS
jgi:hypothetical protein